MHTILLFFLALVGVVFSDEAPTVQLPNGQILGRRSTTFANTPFFAFQKIPYATPPIGSLRFKAPQPAHNWDGILNATYLDVSCYQLQINSPTDSEDCLVLNVYAPVRLRPDALLPVMLYIHGDGFVSGSSINVPSDRFVDNAVILVTINYRLGLFGFASTQNEVIPGNNGLKDQKLAIQWTYENIHLFGGDPEKITLFGQSAGSGSVACQLLNQDSKDLIKGAILQSGSFLSPAFIQRNATRSTFGTASVLNPIFETSDDSEALLQFLQSVDAQDLDDAAEQYLSAVTTPWQYDVSQGSAWAPVIEVQNSYAFLTRKMYGLLQAGNILAVPTLIGFNSEESLSFNPDPEVLQYILQQWDDNLDLIVPDDMQITDPTEHAEMALSIRDIYTGGEPFGTRLGDGIRYSSDNAFTRSIIKHAELFSAFAETYFYQFSYDGEIGGSSIHYDGAESVGHSEEMLYLLCSGSGCDLSSFPESDQITAQRLIKLWTNFAKYQKPTPEPEELFQNVTWPQLSVQEGDFLYLDINENLEVQNHPKAETYQKWSNLYDGLGFSDFDTY